MNRIVEYNKNTSDGHQDVINTFVEYSLAEFAGRPWSLRQALSHRL
jgi:hypothetical protein